MAIIINLRRIQIDMYTDKCVKEITRSVESSYQMINIINNLVLQGRIIELEREIDKLKQDLNSTRVNDGKGKVSVIMEDLENKEK